MALRDIDAVEIDLKRTSTRSEASMAQLSGQRAIVCGSTQGIGWACAEELARQGANVCLVARDAGALKQARDDLPRGEGQNHDTVCADFADRDQVARQVGEYIKKQDQVQVLVNNTGGPPSGPISEAPVEHFLEAFSKHLLCNQLLVQAVSSAMKQARYGRIVNIISTSVIAPIPGLGVSNTTRGAVANWARTWAGELGEYGITINNVLPGYTATARLTFLLQKKAERARISLEQLQADMKTRIPLRRFADPSEIAAVVAFLASPAASYVSGVNLPVDGGRTAVQ